MNEQVLALKVENERLKLALDDAIRKLALEKARADESTLRIQEIARQCALAEANAGRTPAEQDRDAGHLVAIVCAWCHKLIRYEVWPEPMGTSHGICVDCAKRMENQL